jgi:hypothetical protein
MSFDWNNFFDHITDKLTGGAATGLNAADNIDIDSIGGDVIADGALTANEIAPSAATGADIMDGAVIARHIDYSSSPITDNKMAISDAATAVNCAYVALQAGPSTNYLILGAGREEVIVSGAVTNYTGTIQCNTSIFGDPSTGAPVFTDALPVVQFIGTTSIHAAALTAETGAANELEQIDWELELEFQPTGTYTVYIAWAIFGVRTI